MALDFSDLATTQVAGEQAQAATTQGKRPRLDFSDLQQQQKQVLDDSTVDAMASAPKPEAPQGQPRQKETVSISDTNVPAPINVEPVQTPAQNTERFSQGAGAGGDQDTSKEVQGLVTGVNETLRDEGLPTIGAIAGAAAAVAFAPATGGMSLAALGLLGMGVGAGFGEVLEQTGKQAGILPKEQNYKPYETYRELAERAAGRANEEIMWTKVGQVFAKGMSPIADAISNKFFKVPVNQDATSDSFIRVMTKDAEVTGAKNMTVADMTDGSMMKMVEEFTTYDVLTKGGAKIREVRAASGQTLGRNIAQQLEKQTKGLADDVTALADDAIENWTDAAFDNLNSHGVAALVHTSFKKARQVRQSVVNARYNEINEAARIGKYDVTVNTKAVKDGALNEERLLQAGFEEGKAPSLPKSIKQLTGLSEKASFADSYNTLKRMRSELRDLNSAPKKQTEKIRMLKDAEVRLETSMKESVDAVSAQGAMMPDGRSFSEVWDEADSLRLGMTKDFDNKIIEKVIKLSADGDVAAKELAGLYLKDKTVASRIMKVLDDPKHLADPDTALTISAAKRGIKAEVMKDIFVDFDAVRGIYRAPNHSALQDRGDALKKLFTEDEYTDMVDLSNSLRYMDEKLRSKSMEHFQKSRTMGMALKSVGAWVGGAATLTAVNVGVEAQYITGAMGSMMLLSMMGSKALRSPRIMKNLSRMAGPKTDPIVRREAGIYLLHQVENAFSEREKTMTPEYLLRRQQENDDSTEYYEGKK